MTAIRSNFLRVVLGLDAAVCGASGAVFALGGPAVADLTGLSTALTQPVGLFLMGYAALLVWLASRPAVPRTIVWTLVGFNLIWALECAALLALGWIQPTALGVATVAAQGAGAFLVAVLQYMALRQVRAAA